MTDIKSLNYDELVTYMAGLGEKKFRASQLYQWMHEKLADSFDECTNLSNALRQKLKETSEYVCLEPVRVQHSKLDGTEKYLFRLSDGNYVESVLMKYHHGNSVCISSQVGCRMGCRFCASTLNGKVRDLKPSEMLDQIYRIQKISGERVSNVVVMGSGEPMDNYDNLIKFMKIVRHGNPKIITIHGSNRLSANTYTKKYIDAKLLECGINAKVAISIGQKNGVKNLFTI